MIKHKDIANAHALLDGESWHIESGYSRGTGRKRKDKRNCVNYYNGNNSCLLSKKECIGAGKCASYQE